MYNKTYIHGIFNRYVSDKFQILKNMQKRISNFQQVNQIFFTPLTTK